MKKKIFAIIALIIFLALSISLLINNGQNIKKIAHELGIECQTIEIAKNDCVISHYDIDWKFSSTPDYLYKVLYGKEKNGAYIIQIFHKNGAKASDKIHATAQEKIVKSIKPEELKIIGDHLSFYHANGQLFYKIPLYNKEINGFFETYSADGKIIIKQSVKNNELHGLETYYDNGNITIETNYANNEKHGIQKLYYEDEVVWIETQYKNGKRDGIEKEYYKSGSLERETPYMNNEKHGIEKFYFEFSEQITETEYKFGEKINPSK